MKCNYRDCNQQIWGQCLTCKDSFCLEHCCDHKATYGEKTLFVTQAELDAHYPVIEVWER